MDSTISRIYDLKTIGVSNVVSDIDKIIEKLNQVAGVKKAISDTKSTIYDPSQLQAVTSQIDKLNDIQAQTLDQLKELNVTTKQGVTAQSEYAAAITKVATEQKNVTVSMEQSAAALGTNLSATTAGVVKMQAAISSTARTTIDYDSAITGLGGRLAILKDEVGATAAQLKILGDEYRENQITEAEYQRENETLTVQLQQQKTQITEVTAAMTALNRVYNPALLEEENATLAINKVELQQRAQLLKLQAVAENAAANSINEARAQSALYRKELNDLDLATEKGIARQKELIATIAELDLFIKENADLYTRQKINIGNYPTITAEMSALRAEMGRLVVAGEQEGAEFAALSARVKELAAATALVKEETTQAATIGDKFVSITERMGLRMIANLVIFQAAIELGQMLYEYWTKLSDAEQIAKDRLDDYNSSLKTFQKLVADMPSAIAAGIVIDTQNEKDLVDIMTDQTQSIEARTDAYNKLQGVMPGLFHNMTQEQALSQDNAVAINTHASAIIDLQNKINETVKARDAAAKLLAQSEDSQTAVERTYSGTLKDPNPTKTQQINDQTKALKEYNNSLSEMRANLARVNSPELDDDKKGKQPHDYTNAILEAQKKLTDGIAKEAELRLQIEMSEQKLIFDNTQNSLQDRLKAYAIYARDEKEIIKLASDAQILDIQNRLDKIKDIEKKPKDKRTVEENTLLINKDQLTEQLNVLADAYKLKFNSVSESINAGIGGIVKSSLDKTFKDIASTTDAELTKLTDNVTSAENDIYAKKGMGAIGKDKQISKLEEGLKVQTDESALSADQKKINATLEAVQQAHNTKMVELEAQLQRDLLALYKKQAADKKTLQTDLNKSDAKDGELRRQVESSAFEVAQQFSQNYMQLLQKEDAYKQMMAKRQLDWNFKLAGSQVQSQQQQIALEKQKLIADQALEKQKAQDAKKRAIQEATINEGIAATQIIVNTLESPTAKLSPDGGLALAAVQEGALAAMFLSKIALINSAPAYAGGMNPFAWVGDGYEPELLKIGNSFHMSPSTPTLISSQNLQSVTPLSQFGNYSGTMGSQLRAPQFSSSSTGGGSGMEDLKMMMAQMIQHTATQKVILNTPQLTKQQHKDTYKRVSL